MSDIHDNKSHPLLSQLEDAVALQSMSNQQLNDVADEVRDVLCTLLEERSAHFASNLGVVELCLALHSTFDFRHDRLIWDTGHQIYPHKLVTGRYNQFMSIRTKSGLMGYPNPVESDYDLFMTGHAGASVSTVLGLSSGDDILGQDDRRAVAVIGDGAFPSGMVYEALNNAAHLDIPVIVILNDNKMSICPRVGGVASYFDRLRTNPIYTGLKTGVSEVLNKVPVFGDPAERFLQQVKEGVKAGLHGGMMFEEMGFKYFGPIDGHKIGLLKKYLKMVRDIDGPVMLHVITEKGHGYEPAQSDPVYFHSPPQFKDEISNATSAGVVEDDSESVESLPATPPATSPVAARNYTHFATDAIYDQLQSRSDAVVLTAAMCQGNKLEKVRDELASQFFDVGICESHAVAFAAGQAKAGLRPIVAIYSTFLQRSFDQIFQEVALQDLPVTFMLDRAGLAGPDGPTHHGVFDLGYLRLFPNMAVLSPGDGLELASMLSFALEHDGPVAIRYPKAVAPEIQREIPSVELGKAEVISKGTDGTILSCGAMLSESIVAAARLADEGISVGVVNTRFIKPLDEDVVSKALRNSSFVVTVEEAALVGGFGSAVMEFAEQRRINTNHVRRLGIPDIFVEHGNRDELLAELGLDADGICRACREMIDDKNRFSDAVVQ